MTLKEAKDSGKRFKRPNHEFWIDVDFTMFNLDEATADDWVTDDQVVTVTEHQAQEAFKSVAGVIFRPESKKQFMKILGFTDESK